MRRIEFKLSLFQSFGFREDWSGLSLCITAGDASLGQESLPASLSATGRRYCNMLWNVKMKSCFQVPPADTIRYCFCFNYFVSRFSSYQIRHGGPQCLAVPQDITWALVATGSWHSVWVEIVEQAKSTKWQKVVRHECSFRRSLYSSLWLRVVVLLTGVLWQKVANDSVTICKHH